MDCHNCGEPTTNESEICAGAIAYEIDSNDCAVTNFHGLMTCNCCETCRGKCLESMQEEYPN